MVRRTEEGHFQRIFSRALLRQAHQRLPEFCLGTIERSSSTSALCILMLANDAMCIIIHLDFQAKKNGGGVLRDDSRRDFILQQAYLPGKKISAFSEKSCMPRERRRAMTSSKNGRKQMTPNRLQLKKHKPLFG